MIISPRASARGLLFCLFGAMIMLNGKGKQKRHLIRHGVAVPPTFARGKLAKFAARTLFPRWGRLFVTVVSKFCFRIIGIGGRTNKTFSKHLLLKSLPLSGKGDRVSGG